MKLILQIACGGVLGSLVIGLLRLLAAPATLSAFSKYLSTQTLPTHAQVYTAPTLPPLRTPPVNNTVPPDTRQWSITTVDGKKSSGTGPTPAGGLPPK